ncbi:MAG: anti-sigma factor [Litorimonas sp.]
MSTPPNTNDALIIAYLTGQASDIEVVQFQARVGADTAFRDQVERLEAWLAPLNSEADDVSPPAGLLEAIMADIDDTKTAVLSDPAKHNKVPVAANDAGPLRFWRGLAIAASMIAVASLGSHAFIGNAPVPLNDDLRYLALLSGETPSPLVAIVYNPLTGEVVARLSNVEVPDDGDLQLWLIRDGAAAPVSLGLLDRTGEGRVELSIPEELRTKTDTLALSLEAKGGSRSSGPEGPVLYTGRVSALN